MPSNARLSTYRTAIIDNPNELIVRYIATDIVRADATHVWLNSGGWRTVTTKRKMVQASNQFGLGFTVHQRKGEWFVTRLGRSPEGYPSAAPEHGAVERPFLDGMSFPRGTVA